MGGRYYDLYMRQHGLEANLFLAPGEGDVVPAEDAERSDPGSEIDFFVLRRFRQYSGGEAAFPLGGKGRFAVIPGRRTVSRLDTSLAF